MTAPNDDDLLGLQGKVAIVTGGGRGIGRAVALSLGRAGVRVIVGDYGVALDGTSPDPGPAEEVAAEIRRAGGSAQAVFGDVSRMETGELLVRQALDTYGKLDILVCCAGILRDRMIFNMTEEEWDAVIAVHLKGHFSCIKPASVLFRQQRSGRIITFTSASGLEGNPGQPNYAAAKEGIVGLTRSTAVAMGRYNVTCNAVAPGAATRMTASVPDGRRRRRAETPGPEGIGEVVTFLASERAGHITGQVVGVTGDRVSLWSQPRQTRNLVVTGGLTAAGLVDLWASAIGQDEVARFSQLGLPQPGAARVESGTA